MIFNQEISVLLDQIVRRQKDQIALRERIRERAAVVTSTARKRRDPDSDTKTIGIRVPESLRQRIDAQRTRLGVPTYTAGVMLALEIGVEALEMAHDLETRTAG
jgi:PDZ domain-containing secreted protein